MADLLCHFVPTDDAHPPRYDLTDYFSPEDGREYAHVGVMGYMRVRWVDMDAYERIIGTLPPASAVVDQPVEMPVSSHADCPPGDFNDRVSTASVACCGDVDESCPNGIPTTCDAECAAVFPRFWADCRDLVLGHLPEALGQFEDMVQLCNAANVEGGH